jgi:hypothetical protein
MYRLVLVNNYFSLPHEPKFKHVGPSSALYVLVARIVSRVVEFILLEKVLSATRVTRIQNILMLGNHYGALLRRCQHFMRIECHRVCSKNRYVYATALIELSHQNTL